MGVETNLEDKYAELNRYQKLLGNLNQFTIKLKSNFDQMIGYTEESLFDFFLNEAVALVEKSKSATFLLVDDKNKATWVACVGHEHMALHQDESEFYENIKWLISRDFSDEILVVDNVNDIPEIVPILSAAKLNKNVLKSAITIPIKIGNSRAYMNLEGESYAAFDHIDVEILNLYKAELECFLEMRKIKNENETLIKRDLVTECLKRSYFEQLILESDGYCTLKKVWLIDILKLSHVNKIYGWDIGDLLLKKLAEYLRNVHLSAECVRYEADALLLLLPPDTEVTETEIDQLLYQFYDEGVSKEDLTVHAAAVAVFSMAQLTSEAYFKSMKHLTELLNEKKFEIDGGLPIFRD